MPTIMGIMTAPPPTPAMPPKTPARNPMSRLMNMMELSALMKIEKSPSFLFEKGG
jgi:hypothetical protein